MERIKEFYAVLRHKAAFLQVRNSNAYLRQNISLIRALMHDTGKAINILLLGDRLATKIHRRLAGHHHEDKMSLPQKVEAFCDWECARLTKPSKPLDGIQTWRTYYSHVDMAEVVSGFLDQKK